MEEDNISRRKFVSTGAIAVSGLATLGLSGLGNAVFNKDVVRVGIIGTGSRGTGLAHLIKEIPAMQVVACCDIIPEHLQNGLKEAAEGARAYTDYRKLLEDKSIQAVIIATPLYLHYPMAIHAIEAGKHIYLEKSLAYTIPECIALVKAVRNSKLVFQVGYQYRYSRMYHKVKDVIRENWLGKITHFECQYNRNANWRVPVDDPQLERVINWRMYRLYCGGLLSELCSHQIDQVNYFLGSHPLKVTGIGGIDYWKDGRDTYDNIRTIYEYPNGVKSSVTSILSNAFNGYLIRILGDVATLEIQRDKAFIYAESTDNAKAIVDGVTGATKKAITHGEGVELVFDEPGRKQSEPTTDCLIDFLGCIQNNRKPVSNVETARDASIAVLIGNKAADTQSFQVWEDEYSLA
jgi:predicted dehydrogenase